MKPIILKIVSTSKGWIIRQGMKWASLAGVGAASSLAAFAMSKGVSAEHAKTFSDTVGVGLESVIVGTLSILLLIAENWLSNKAKGIAVEDSKE